MATIPEITNITIQEEIQPSKPTINCITLELNKTNGIKKTPDIVSITLFYGKWEEETNNKIPLFNFAG